MPSADWTYIDLCYGCKEKKDIQYIEIIKPDKPGKLHTDIPFDTNLCRPYCTAKCVKQWSNPKNKVVRC